MELATFIFHCIITMLFCFLLPPMVLRFLRKCEKAWGIRTYFIYAERNFTNASFVEHSRNFKSEDIQKDMRGKTCIVTRASSGIGCAIARGFASRGATVYMVCRSQERGEAAVSEIRAVTRNMNVYLEVCDTYSIDDIKLFATNFFSKNKLVHILVHSDGLLNYDTSEGYDINHPVDNLSTYTMTEKLLPLLENAAPDARVITVASGAIYLVPSLEGLQGFGRDTDRYLQYAMDKRLQVALTEKWADMYKDKGIAFYSMHPGWVATPYYGRMLSGRRVVLRTPENGADTVIWLALEAKEKLKSGGFYFDRAEAPKHLPFTSKEYTDIDMDSIMLEIRKLSGP